MPNFISVPNPIVSKIIGAVNLPNIYWNATQCIVTTKEDFTIKYIQNVDYSYGISSGEVRKGGHLDDWTPGVKNGGVVSLTLLQQDWDSWLIRMGGLDRMRTTTTQINIINEFAGIADVRNVALTKMRYETHDDGVDFTGTPNPNVCTAQFKFIDIVYGGKAGKIFNELKGTTTNLL